MIISGDCLTTLTSMAGDSIDCAVTSPPYWGLRDYGVPGQLGMESTPEEYVARLVEVFRELRRVLKPGGTLWLNLGDSYANSGGKTQPHRDSSGGIGKKGTRGEQPYHGAGGGFERPSSIGKGLKPKDLVGIPWRVAFALQADGWYLRQDIIWHKPNPMPESVRDRCTKAHEYIFLLSKSEKYFYDADAVKEPAVYTGLALHSGDLGQSKDGMRNKRSVWTVSPKPFKGAHFATFPPDLIEPCILAGCPAGGVVLDPFFGAGTTGLVAKQHGRGYVGIELNAEYVTIARQRIEATG